MLLFLLQYWRQEQSCIIYISIHDEHVVQSAMPPKRRLAMRQLILYDRAACSDRIIQPILSSYMQPLSHPYLSPRVPVTCSNHRPSHIRLNPPKIWQNHKLSLSKLKLPPLLLLLTTPNLKYFSSPVAVRPPMYHFSAPSTSLKPSELLSLPRLPRGLVIYLPLCCSAPGDVEGVCVPGDVLNGLAEFVRGEWRVERAAAVAPGFVDVVIVRGFEVCVEEVVCAG